MAVSCKSEAIMIANHNETKAFRITFFPEMHVAQVEIVAKNQYLKIGILKQSKIRALGSGHLECQNGQRRLGHAVQHLTDRESVYKIKANYPGADSAE